MSYTKSEDKEQICKRKQDDITSRLRSKRQDILQQRREHIIEQEERQKRIAEMKVESEHIQFIKQKYHEIETDVVNQLCQLTTQPNEMLFAQVLTMMQTNLLQNDEIKIAFVERVIPQMMICLHVHLSQQMFKSVLQQQERCIIYAMQIIVHISSMSPETLTYIEEKSHMIDILFDVLNKGTYSIHYTLEAIEELSKSKMICNMFYDRHIITKIVNLLSATNDQGNVYTHTAIILSRCLDANYNPEMIVLNNISLFQKLLLIDNTFIQFELLQAFKQKYKSKPFIISTRILPMYDFALKIFNETTDSGLFKEALMLMGNYIFFEDNFQFTINLIKAFANRKQFITTVELQTRVWWILSNACLSNNIDIVNTIIEVGFFDSCCKTLIHGNNERIKTECCFLLTNMMTKIENYDKIIKYETFSAILLALELRNSDYRKHLLTAIIRFIQKYLAVGDRSILDSFLELQLPNIIDQMNESNDVMHYKHCLVTLEKIIKENTQIENGMNL